MKLLCQIEITSALTSAQVHLSSERFFARSQGPEVQFRYKVLKLTFDKTGH